MNKLRLKIINSLLTKNEKVLSTTQEIDLRLRIMELRKELKEMKPLTRGELTMAQLGSFLPNFKGLNNETNEFKKNVGMMCDTLRENDLWKYLLTNLKQDQVNTTILNGGEEGKSEEFMRGSINGIYIVEQQIESLGATYKMSNIAMT